MIASSRNARTVTVNYASMVYAEPKAGETMIESCRIHTSLTE